VKDSDALDKKSETLAKLRKLGWITENGTQAPLPKKGHFVDDREGTAPRFDRTSGSSKNFQKR
jgi:hypothetical protein